MREDSLEKLGLAFIVLILVLCVVGLVLEARNETAHGGCAERRPTGGLICTGNENFKTCTPITECVRFNDGTTP